MQQQNQIPLKNTFLSTNRFIAKLFGERNHDFLSIDSDTTLSISKRQVDKIEKKAQISQWRFELDQIYSEEVTFDQLYENEIDCNDYLNNFSSSSIYRNIVFVTDNSDSLIEEPFITFIRNCVEECMRTLPSSHTILISYVEILNKSSKTVDKFANKLINSKVICYEDDAVILEASQVPIDTISKFDDLIAISSKYKSEFNYSQSSTSEVITIRLCDKETNYCQSKLNFVLYKAYEIRNNEESKKGDYKIFTKDNYDFFNSAHSLLHFRVSYIMPYLRDVFQKKNGKNLFILFVPCEYEYLILLHDMLNYVKMRKLTMTNYSIETKEELDEMIGQMNGIDLNDNPDNFNDNKENESLNDTQLTGAESFIGTVAKKERKNINVERLKKIENKKQVKKFFDYLDKINE